MSLFNQLQPGLSSKSNLLVFIKQKKYIQLWDRALNEYTTTRRGQKSVYFYHTTIFCSLVKKKKYLLILFDKKRYILLLLSILTTQLYRFLRYVGNVIFVSNKYNRSFEECPYKSHSSLDNTAFPFVWCTPGTCKGFSNC